MARMLSYENFLKGGISVGYGVFLSSFGFSCTTLWLVSDPHGTAVTQKNMCVLTVYLQKILCYYRI